MKYKLNAKAVVAELFGTFLLTFAVYSSLNNPEFPVPTPLIAAATLGILVYTIGPISGCHINPAVTIGLLLVKKIDIVNSLGYIAAQFAGAFLAAFTLLLFISEPFQPEVNNDFTTLLAEAMGAFVLMFGVSAVVFNKALKDFSGVVIGSSLFVGIAIAAIGSAGILNPAVALGLGVTSPAYFLGPIVGAILGVTIFKLLSFSAEKSKIKQEEPLTDVKIEEKKPELPPLPVQEEKKVVLDEPIEMKNLEVEKETKKVDLPEIKEPITEKVKDDLEPEIELPPV